MGHTTALRDRPHPIKNRLTFLNGSFGIWTPITLSSYVNEVTELSRAASVFGTMHPPAFSSCELISYLHIFLVHTKHATHLKTLVHTHYLPPSKYPLLRLVTKQSVQLKVLTVRTE